MLHEGKVGSITHTVDMNGSVRNEYDYDTFGTRSHVKTAGTGSNQNFGYTGEMFDAESGLLYLRARYYDPSIGRFISADPYLGRMAEPVTQNRFIYVHNNPLLYSDPSGLDAVEIDFWGYPVDTGYGFKVDAIHSGTLLIDEKTGLTNYYEYGRYSNSNDPSIIGHFLPGKSGNVRKITVSDVVIGENGLPTEESLQNVYKELATLAGKGIQPTTTYHDDVDFAKSRQYALDFANNKDRSNYSLFSNSCVTVQGNIIDSGR